MGDWTVSWRTVVACAAIFAGYLSPWAVLALIVWLL
jgi:hypothetical protein